MAGRREGADVQAPWTYRDGEAGHTGAGGWSVYRKGSARETQAAYSDPISSRRTAQQGPLASATGLICRTCTAAATCQCRQSANGQVALHRVVLGTFVATAAPVVSSVWLCACAKGSCPLSAQQLGFSTAGRVQGAVLKSQGFRTGAPAPLTSPAYGVAFSFLQPSTHSCSATPCVRTVCMHRYWHDKGVVCIVTGRVLNLAALGFTIAFSGETSHWHATSSEGNAASSRGPGGGIQDWLAQGRLGQDERASWRCCCCCTSGAGSGA